MEAGSRGQQLHGSVFVEGSVTGPRVFFLPRFGAAVLLRGAGVLARPVCPSQSVAPVGQSVTPVGQSVGRSLSQSVAPVGRSVGRSVGGLVGRSVGP